METYEEIQAKIEQLQRQATQIRDREKAEAISGMKAAIAKYGITSTELGFTARHLTPANKSAATANTPKYQDPNTGKSWSGRGRAPKWLEEAKEAGKTKEDFLVA
ncbi:H-NS family nucleoid-associated regulatory protein [Pandoraea sp. SD6-2]|uniref:H-NS histone family protein n=1 Tax=Pandoraea sp. SD6-2 TaxID=1286093 RepID=UPI00032D6DE6|nr:H-NS histone family protein [Pandoraea sp. SD6-2]EON11356.1 histone family protein nucleoid-structuring protein H-NS [Pandoraea sp. SD6-2]